MANPSRKKRKRKASVVGAVLKLLFLLLLLSMLAAYIANQVALSSKKAELDTLQEQIDQQKTPERGDAAHPQRRLGRRDRVGCAGLLQLCGGQRAHLRGCDGQLMPRPERLAAGGKHISQQGVLSFGD